MFCKDILNNIHETVVEDRRSSSSRHITKHQMKPVSFFLSCVFVCFCLFVLCMHCVIEVKIAKKKCLIVNIFYLFNIITKTLNDIRHKANLFYET